MAAKKATKKKGRPLREGMAATRDIDKKAEQFVEGAALGGRKKKAAPKKPRKVDYTTVSLPHDTAALGRRLVIARSMADGELPRFADVVLEALELLAKDYRRRGWTLPAKAPTKLARGPKPRP